MSEQRNVEAQQLEHLDKDDLLEEGQEDTCRISSKEEAMKETTFQQYMNAIDWNDENDSDNPHNWPLWLRVYHAMLPALFGFAVTFGTSVYTPAVVHVMADFKVSRTAAIIGLSVYTLGLGFGPVISAPLSENYGRKIVYMASSPIFMLFTLGAGFSKSFASLVVCRLFAGIMGSPALAVGGGTIADLFPAHQRATVTSMFLMAPFAGPALGPVVGGFAAQYKGWQWSQWCIIFITLATYVIALPMRETYKPMILRRRAAKYGLNSTRNHEIEATAMKRTIVQNFLRPLHMLFTEPVVFFLSLYTAFAFGVLFLLLPAIPFIFARPPYSFTISQVGLTFLAIGLGVLFGSGTGLLVDRFIYQPRYRRALEKGQTNAKPEHRLYSAMMGGWGLPIGLFWLGWCADKGVHWVVCLLGAIPFAWGNLCLFISTVLYTSDVYGPSNGASALAANGILRYTLGAVFPLFTVQMYEAMGIGWATSFIGFLSIVMLPIPWIFFKWGPAIRERSRYPVVM